MNNINITTDIDVVYDQFINFTTKEMRSTLSNAIKASGNELKKMAKSNLRKSVKNSNKINPKYNDSLQQGVRTGRVKETKEGEIYCYVLITSTNKTGSGSYRLHILENGSFRVGKRFAKTYNGKPLKKPRYTGILKPTNFYKDAEGRFLPNYTNILNSNIDKAVSKINNTKFGK